MKNIILLKTELEKLDKKAKNNNIKNVIIYFLISLTLKYERIKKIIVVINETCIPLTENKWVIPFFLNTS